MLNMTSGTNKFHEDQSNFSILPARKSCKPKCSSSDPWRTHKYMQYFILMEHFTDSKSTSTVRVWTQARHTIRRHYSTEVIKE